MKIKHYFLLTLVLLIIDQSTKLLVSECMQLGESIVVSSFFNLTYVHNHGAAFSFLADEGGWQRYLLSSISVIVSIFIAVWMTRVDPKHILRLSALTVLLAGAIGNLVDRLAYGFVIDFIDLHYQDFYYPVFNVADSLITIGVVMLIFSDRKSK